METRTLMGPPLRPPHKLRNKTPDGRIARNSSGQDHGEFGLDQIHPLLIDHILEQIFVHLYRNLDGADRELIPSDLKNCRLVCKTWHCRATSVFRKLSRVEIDLSNSTLSFLRSRGQDRDPFLARFMSSFRRTNVLPFHTFRMDVNFFVRENEEHFLEFLSLAGPWVSNLVLIFGKNYTMEFHNQEKFNQRTVSLPELKGLQFQCAYMTTRTLGPGRVEDNLLSSEQQLNGTRNLLELLLRGAGKLKSLDFCVHFQHFAVEENPRFGEIVAKSMGKNVTSLKLITDISNQDLDALSKKDLAMQLLHFNFYGSSLNSESVIKFLDSQKETLNDLNIGDVEGRPAEGLKFPILPVLKKLEIKGYQNSSFNYIKSFPMLSSLILRNKMGRSAIPQGDNLDGEGDAIEKFAYPTLEHLELANFAPVLFINKIAKCFPNLKSLQLKIDTNHESTLIAVFDQFRNLEELFIYFPEFFGNLQADPIFTGFSPQVCKEMLEKHDFDIIVPERRPNLEDLKNLTTLTIKAESYALDFTDITASLLLRMPKLQKMVTSQHNMTVEYLNRLKEKMELTVLKQV